MKLCNDTITVFNAYLDKDRGADIYLPTVISGVSWYLHTVTTVDPSGGLRAANQLTVRIPAGADFNGKTYVDPLSFAAVADPSGLFTLKAGDTVARGDFSDVGRVSPAALKSLTGEVGTVLAVTDNRRAPHAPHWKLVGK